MVERIKKLSLEQGFPRSRLPKFTVNEVARIKGTSDFFGLNTYAAYRVTLNDATNSANYSVPSEEHDAGVVRDFDPAWNETNSVWFRVRCQGWMS